MAYTVQTWHGNQGEFATKARAVAYAKRLRKANRQAGNKGAVKVVKLSKKNPGTGKTVRLRNFTGTVKLNPNKTVSVRGKAKRANPSRGATISWTVYSRTRYLGNVQASSSKQALKFARDRYANYPSLKVRKQWTARD